MVRSGIYKITNTVNGKVYIGSAVDIERRWKKHQYNLSHNRNEPNEHIQGAWNKYGAESFIFEVVELVSELSQLYAREKYWIVFYGALDTLVGYNKCLESISQLGIKRSEETRRKISESQRGERGSCYGKPRSEETKRKISEAKKGKRHTGEARQKMSESHMGKKTGEEHPMYGKHRSEESRQKISESLRGRGSKFEFQGEFRTLRGWSDLFGIKLSTLSVRVQTRGWTIERALTTPMGVPRGSKFEFQGEVRTLREWGNIFGISPSILSTRVQVRGWSIERALTTPIRGRK